MFTSGHGSIQNVWLLGLMAQLQPARTLTLLCAFVRAIVRLCVCVRACAYDGACAYMCVCPCVRPWMRARPCLRDCLCVYVSMFVCLSCWVYFEQSCHIISRINVTVGLLYHSCFTCSSIAITSASDTSLYVKVRTAGSQLIGSVTTVG